MARALMLLVALTGTAAIVIADARQSTPRPGSRISTAVTCAADLGSGTKSKRQFCDVLIGGSGPRSIVFVVPAHRGEATLMFDLHNRFTVPARATTPAEAFSRQTALIAVVSAAGGTYSQAVVSREYRTVADLFDRIAAAGRAGQVKAVAPGFPEPIQVTLPADATAAAIVGLRLEATTKDGDARFDAPGRPVAIASNFRLEYVPR